jgi:uncharacterized low-complexity protein|nr:hypothetical protein [Caballeronia glathei]
MENGREEALRQQRSHANAMHGDEGACGDGVVASHGTARQDGECGQEAAIDKPAAAIGDGHVGAGLARVLTFAPSDQRASDSHDYTRLAVLTFDAPWMKHAKRFTGKGRGLVPGVLVCVCMSRRFPMFEDIRAKNAVNTFFR